MEQGEHDVTKLLLGISGGSQDAKKRLFTLVYRELHAMAHSSLRRESDSHPLQTTDLVHETYLRLVPCGEVQWRDRRHFFSVAATAMRRILVDIARKKKTAKRGQGVQPLPLDEARVGLAASGASEPIFNDLTVVDRALKRLETSAEGRRKCRVVELRFFIGFTIEQTAEILGVSAGTVKRDWNFARALLRRQITRELRDAGGSA